MAHRRLIRKILALIAIGIAVAVGSMILSKDAFSGNREDIVSDLAHIAARAHQYYRRPIALGGGGRSFVGLWADYTGSAKIIPWPGGKNSNGTYLIQSAGTANQVVIEAWGNERLPDSSRLTLRIVVRDGGRTDSLYESN